MNKVLNRIFRFLASLELTVYGLALFLILVIWGTIYQASHGLYAAQKDIFHAWIFWLVGLIPLPGLILAGFVLTLNLVMALIVRIRWSWRNLGLLLIHLGIILFLAGGFLSRRLSQESYLTLAEGESAAFSSSARDWEVAVWTRTSGDRTVSALSIEGLRTGERLDFKTFGLSFQVLAVYANSRMVGSELQPLAVFDEMELNAPGLSLQTEGGPPLALYAGQTEGISIVQASRAYTIQLRPRRYPLPVEIRLLDFKKEIYPGSEIPRSFASQVNVIQADGFQREARISMNRPLRIGAYTFYQSSYDDSGPIERSTFSVVRNTGRLLPYYASLLTFLGLLWFALQRLRQGRRKTASGHGEV